MIFKSPRGVTVGAKDGDVTMVEFFVDNCGYCKRAMTDMMELMKSDPKLKVVLKKEFPVLGPGSVEAAQVGVAVAHAGPHRQEVSRLSPEAAERQGPGRQGALDGRRQGSRRRRRGSGSKRISPARKCAPRWKKTSSSPNRWA